MTETRKSPPLALSVSFNHGSVFTSTGLSPSTGLSRLNAGMVELVEIYERDRTCQRWGCSGRTALTHGFGVCVLPRQGGPAPILTQSPVREDVDHTFRFGDRHSRYQLTQQVPECGDRHSRCQSAQPVSIGTAGTRMRRSAQKTLVPESKGMEENTTVR